MKLENRYALITGGSQGLGKAIARSFVTEGASVMLCARNERQLSDAKEQLSPYLNKSRQILIRTADVSDPVQVDQLIKCALDEFPHLDIVVNNAGIYGPKGSVEGTDWDEWENAIRVNLFGTVLMCRGVLPHFKQRRCGKIINLSGGGATNPLPRLSAYAASKAAVVRFTETLAEETRDFGIDVNAIAPGPLNTRLLEEVLEAGPEKVGSMFYEKASKQKVNGGTPLEKGASLSVFLASAASDGITGKLLSAVWDPWEILADHVQELSNTDIYTLRRIVPKDRAKSWGTSS